jgi:hypothetical protein
LLEEEEEEPEVVLNRFFIFFIFPRLSTSGGGGGGGTGMWNPRALSCCAPPESERPLAADVGENDASENDCAAPPVVRCAPSSICRTGNDQNMKKI